MWLLTLVRDRNGNWIKLEYTFSKNLYRPKIITYGASGTQAPVGKVVFSYDDKDLNPRWQWDDTRYVAGEEIKIEHPLIAITSYHVNGRNETKVVRSIHFAYETDPLTGQLQMDSIWQDANRDHMDRSNAILLEWKRTSREQRPFIGSSVQTIT